MSRSKRYTDDYKEMIVRLYKSGMALVELSSEYCIAKSIISDWVKELREIKVNLLC